MPDSFTAAEPEAFEALDAFTAQTMPITAAITTAMPMANATMRLVRRVPGWVLVGVLTAADLLDASSIIARALPLFPTLPSSPAIRQHLSPVAAPFHVSAFGLSITDAVWDPSSDQEYESHLQNCRVQHKRSSGFQLSSGGSHSVCGRLVSHVQGRLRCAQWPLESHRCTLLPGSRPIDPE